MRFNLLLRPSCPPAMSRRGGTRRPLEKRIFFFLHNFNTIMEPREFDAVVPDPSCGVPPPTRRGLRGTFRPSDTAAAPSQKAQASHLFAFRLLFPSREENQEPLRSSGREINKMNPGWNRILEEVRIHLLNLFVKKPNGPGDFHDGKRLG